MEAEDTNRNRDLICPKCRWSHVPVQSGLPDGLYSGPCTQCGHTLTFAMPLPPRVSLIINGKQYTVDAAQQSMSLFAFLRHVARLPGTKVMCFEGGCGACVVTTSYQLPGTKEEVTKAVNACLVPIPACDGWCIETVEGIGNQREGYHPIQERITETNGSQCGYCTPGMVMNMYSLLKANPNRTASEIEQAFDGNLCRCTGYRTILDAMKSFSTDQGRVADIEDIAKRFKLCKKTGNACNDTCQTAQVDVTPIPVKLKGALWQRPAKLDDLKAILKVTSEKKVRFVAGDSGKGIYKGEGPFDVCIYLRNIPLLAMTELRETGLEIGATLDLNALIAALENYSTQKGFGYFTQMASHFRVVANVPVRNVASWAGNLMLKWHHRDFVSDIFTVLEAVQAKIKIMSADGSITICTPEELLNTDMKNKVILAMTLGFASEQDYFMSYKIRPRSQNAHAYVNCAIWMKLDPSQAYRVLERPRIVYAGINENMVHAANVEEFLHGKGLLQNDLLQGALQCLESEIQPNADPVLAATEYRKNVAVALLYKFVLYVCRDQVDSRFTSGGQCLERPLSTGKQVYQLVEENEKYPVYAPMTKAAAKIQASGEAEYVSTMGEEQDQVYIQFVLSTVGNATIDDMDASEALVVPGVLRFLTHKDIPTGGYNSFVSKESAVTCSKQEALCSGKVLYAGQPVGIIVADSYPAAVKGARKVKVTYKDRETPIISVQEAVARQNFFPKKTNDLVIGNVESAIRNSVNIIHGNVASSTQYHFPMETIAVVCRLRDNGIDVYATTQWMDQTQIAVAQILGINQSSVHVESKRLGGSFGGKGSPPGLVAAGCALACKLMNRPARCQLSLSDSMAIFGGRHPYYMTYEAGVTAAGQLNGIRVAYYEDLGSSENDSVGAFMPGYADSAYKCENWQMTFQEVMTNTPPNTFCRGPGSTEAVFLMDTVMEHIAKEIGKDPLEVKRLNFYKEGDISLTNAPLKYCNIGSIDNRLGKSVEIALRQKEVKAFNESNRWLKRGLGIVPMKFGLCWGVMNYSVLVSVFNGDGTVAVSHAGIEVGQGINTKVMQVCAAELGIPHSLITCRPADSMIGANAMETAGSVTSELCCLGVIECCNEIKSRMKAATSHLPENTSWQDKVKTCYLKNVDLCARSWVDGADRSQQEMVVYYSYGMACAEAELDVLTGENVLRRADVLMDCGKSLNPLIDIGQVEGAFVMGLGNHLMERIKYDPDTGRVLSNSTWEYKIPTTKDIPADFRVELLGDAPNPFGVLGAKGVGEPPLTMACSALVALRHAVESAREETGVHGFCPMDSPATPDILQPKCLTQINQLIL